MAKTICKILGVVFLLIGVIGFVMPGFLGLHLSVVHNLVHIISGATALYLGFAGTLAAARLFCIGFGILYLLLAVAGFLLGSDQAPTIAGMADMGRDAKLWRVIPGQLELGTMDHILHVLLGVVFLIGGFLTKAEVERAVD